MAFVCEDCGKRILNLFNYNRHKSAKISCKLKQRLKGGKYVCPQCPALFTRRDNLDRHVKVWHGNSAISHVRHYACGVGSCDKVFSDLAKLKDHRQQEHEVHHDFKLVASAHNKSCQLLRTFFPPAIKSLDEALHYSYDLLTVLLTTLLVHFKYFKVNLTMSVEMLKLDETGQPIICQTFPFGGNGIKVTRGIDFKRDLQRTLGDIERNCAEFIFQGESYTY